MKFLLSLRFNHKEMKFLLRFKSLLFNHNHKEMK
jgi:hypothetical protein